MAHYRFSEFLPVALLGAAGSVSRPVGRGIDVVERQDELIGPVVGDGGDSSPIPSDPQQERERAPLAMSFPFTSDPVDLLEVEDRRLFNPERRLDASVPVTVRGSKTRLDASSFPQMASRVVYKVPARSVVTCVKRKIRREVILAKGHGGANRYVRPKNWEVCE